MKIKSILLLTIGILIISCKTNSIQEIKTVDIANKKSIVIKHDTNKVIPTIGLLQGTWAENVNENALFYIQNDSLFYTENQDSPVLIKLHSDTLVIMGDVPVNCKILKLTADSLWYIDQFNTTPTKLYKKK